MDGESGAPIQNVLEHVVGDFSGEQELAQNHGKLSLYVEQMLFHGNRTRKDRVVPSALNNKNLNSVK